MDDTSAVEVAITRFYAALNAVLHGDAGPMGPLWSDDADVTVMGPNGGRQQGSAGIRAYWAAQASLSLGGRVAARQIHIVVICDVAYASSLDQAELPGAEGPVAFTFRATNIFRRQGEEWVLVHHHTDAVR